MSVNDQKQYMKYIKQALVGLLLAALSTFVCAQQSLCDLIPNQLLAEEHINRAGLYSEISTVPKNMYGTSAEMSRVTCFNKTGRKPIPIMPLLSSTKIQSQKDQDIVRSAMIKYSNQTQQAMHSTLPHTRLAIRATSWHNIYGLCNRVNSLKMAMVSCWGIHNGHYLTVIFDSYYMKDDKSANESVQKYFESLFN